MSALDLTLDQRNAGDTGFDERLVSPVASALFGFDASKLPVVVTVGTGLALVGNVLTASASAPVWGVIGGTLSNQTDLQTALNAKQNSLTIGNLTETTSAVLTITGGSAAIIGSGLTIQVKQASGSQAGYLASADLSTFNNKQSAGSYLTALTGDGTASGPGSAALVLATVNSNVGSFGSSTSIPSFTVNAKGLVTAASGNAVIAPAGTLSGTTLAATVVTSSLTAVGTIATGVWNGTAVAVGFGGTGLASGTSGGVPYFSASNTMASSGALTANALVIGGGAGAAPATTTTGANVLTALGIAVGSAGAFVTFNGAGGTPSSITLTNATGYPTASTTVLGVVKVDGTSITISGGVISAAGSGSGTVTTVGFTGGLISVANPTTTPALTVAGTSGGIPYFSSASTWASSAALAANALVVGGGAGATPATITTGTGVVTALGVNVGSAGAFVTFNGALGTPSSGTVTNLTGTASININGTVGATTPATGAFTTIAHSGAITGTFTGQAANTYFTGYNLVNSTPASSGNQMHSPSIYLEGQGWKTTATAASQPVSWRVTTIPRQGAAAPTAELRFSSNINGGSYTDKLTLDSAGNLILNSGSITGVGTLIAANLNSTGDTETTGLFTWNNGTGLTSTTDGAIELYDSTQTTFNRLNFGGTTSSFPSIQRSGTTLTIGTANGGTSAGSLVVSGTLAVTGHVTFEGVTSTGATGTGKLVFDGSPTLTTAVLGSSTATSQAVRDNSTKVATTAYADRAALVGNAAVVLTESAGAVTIDCSLGNTFTLTLNANLTTVTLSSFSDGQVITVAVLNTASNYTVTWGNSIKWAGASQPVQTVGAKTDVWTIAKLTSTLYGSVVQNMS